MSNDPLASVTKGVTSAAIEWTEEKIKLLVAQFRDRRVVFVQDSKTIAAAREKRKVPEYDLFSKYVFDETLRLLFRLGLILRDWECDVRRRDNLRTKIVGKYGLVGLHVAEFAQNGFFSKYLVTIMTRIQEQTDLTCEIEDFFRNMEKMVSFIKETDNVEKKAKEIITRIHSNLPNTYIIFSSVSATSKCSKVKKLVMDEISDYTVELYKTQAKEVYFINKVTS
ncbi:hypothetical protein MUP77_24395 [Candidatus Bathyarchaeota archaeon]|nr:hypothetical protein [Candidatus Bathyarchaeota archaeon]